MTRTTLLSLLILSASAFCFAEDNTDSPAAVDAIVAEATQADDKEDAGPAAGHSRHGEVFNEGPRQQAALMPGMGDISFEVSSDEPLVQKFIEQGIGQLHGFWYFEAERSFRQAAMLDPECAIAYWGMAAANANNDDRARDFVEQAKELAGDATEREQMYISALHRYLTGDGKKKEREAAYVEDVEALIEKFPKDFEAKALLGFLLYKYRGSADRTHAEVDVVLDEILAKKKSHPVHHYRIHLWDQKSPQRALDSAAKCGPAAGGIAHMWHMCGHIFSRVKRYGDAAWFQEASARVDHRHMMHDMVLPDQIHNFAHNNEWFIRNMMNVGRTREAISLARNMIELPRHPKYNTLEKRKSSGYGRDRLMNVLERFELWDEAIALGESAYLEPTEKEDHQLKRLRLLGIARASRGDLEEANRIVDELQSRVELVKAEPPTMEMVLKEMAEEEAEDEDGEDEADGDEKGGDEKDGDEGKHDDETSEEKIKKDREKRLKKKQDAHEDKIEAIEHKIAAIKGYAAISRGELVEALELLEEADESKMAIARVRVRVGEPEEAVKEAKKYAKDRKNQVTALAGLVEVQWLAGNHSEAAEAFIDLRANSNWLELDSPVFQRLAPIAAEFGYPEDWRIKLPPADDLGEQPDLDTLGPFRWQPAPAPDWLLPEADGTLQSMRGYRGRPVLMVFYLGYGCLHCAEQLQAIAPKVEEFEKAGISIVAISSDNIEGLGKSQENYDGEKIPFPLVANPSHDVFKQFRAYDDFEDLPLHGTFLIDGKGQIRWQDISYDPFMDVEFLLNESKRLLDQDKVKRESPGGELADR